MPVGLLRGPGARVMPREEHFGPPGAAVIPVLAPSGAGTSGPAGRAGGVSRAKTIQTAAIAKAGRELKSRASRQPNSTFSRPTKRAVRALPALIPAITRAFARARFAGNTQREMLRPAAG